MTNLPNRSSASPTIRKAAIVISTLDTRAADAILDRMPAEQADLVRQAIMELDDIPNAEQDSVIRQFIQRAPSVSTELDQAVELEPSLVKKLTSGDHYEPVSSGPPAKSPRFQQIAQAGADAIVRHLEQQHPQVVAVVVAHLEPAQAAEVVKRLPAKLQPDILRRVAELDRADPEIVREIELELEQRLSAEIQAAQNRAAGLSTVAAILQAAGRDGVGLLDNLASHEHELADMLVRHPSYQHVLETPRPSRPFQASTVGTELLENSGADQRTASGNPFRTTAPERTAAVARTDERLMKRQQVANTVSLDDRSASRKTPGAKSANVSTKHAPMAFEELSKLSDNDWAKVIHSIDSSVMLLALAGASESFLQRITENIPPREAQGLRKRLEQTGPVRLADIDQAQRCVVENAQRLAREGAIRLPVAKQFAAAA